MMFTAKTDEWHHQQERQLMVDLIRRKGIMDEDVLSAMATVPRHFFIKTRRFTIRQDQSFSTDVICQIKYRVLHFIQQS